MSWCYVVLVPAWNDLIMPQLQFTVIKVSGCPLMRSLAEKEEDLRVEPVTPGNEKMVRYYDGGIVRQSQSTVGK